MCIQHLYCHNVTDILMILLEELEEKQKHVEMKIIEINK